MTIFSEAKYLSLPEISRYVKRDRFENPKEAFKNCYAEAARVADVKAPLSVIDIGCANGELLYFINQQGTNWKLRGIDPAPEFIEVAKTVEGLEEVDFSVKSLDEVEGQYDLVLCVGTFQIFQEFESPLGKMLSICKDGGWLVIEGFFNPLDVEVRVVFCDNSTPEGRGKWRADLNWHSRRTVGEFLKDKVKSFDFHEQVMDVDLDFDPDRDPHIWCRSMRAANGENLVFNGTNMLNKGTFLVIRK